MLTFSLKFKTWNSPHVWKGFNMIDVLDYCNVTPWGEELTIRISEYKTKPKVFVRYIAIHIPTKSDITNPEFRKTLNNQLRGWLYA